MTEIEKLLKEPFAEQDIEWRIGRSGFSAKGPYAQILAYVTARAAQERLDSVFGWDGWKPEYRTEPHGTICRLGVRLESGEWMWKEDGAQETTMESFKGGISGAFKRVCASGYGIGRYLYYLGDTWADCAPEKTPGYNYAKTKDGKVFWWRVPNSALPAWALPGGNGKPLL